MQQPLGVRPGLPVSMNSTDTLAPGLSSGKVIERLRAETVEQHRTIENLTRLSGDFSVAHYGRTLQAFESFLTQWEPLVTGALPVSMRPWSESLRRLYLARRDMAALALAPLESVAIDLTLRDKSAALGSMYVMEGSTLGGVVIARHLRRQHGIEAHNGGAYFSGWGANTAANWLQFRQLLEAHVDPDESARKGAATAAADTFRALSQTLQRAFDANLDC